MEKIPKNLEIGDQEFQRVGEMKSEDTELKHAPESFDLYQDTESGALMGDLPRNHPVMELTRKIERRAENDERLEAEGFDLTQLTPSEADRLLTRFSIKKLAIVNRNEWLKIYGKINDGSEGELAVCTLNIGISNVHHLVFYKDDISIIEGSMSDMILKKDFQWKEIEPMLVNYRVVEIEPEHSTIAGKNSLLIGNGKGSAEISFLEIPKAYTELMEKKAGKAE